jgi:hypothetical protein
MSVVLAGRSSLGTEAACLAFTNPDALGVIHKKLAAEDVDLDDHRRPFAVLASLSRNRDDGKEEANLNSLTVELVQRLVPR